MLTLKPSSSTDTSHLESGTSDRHGDDRVRRSWLAFGSVGLFALTLLQHSGSIVHETKLDLVVNPGSLLARIIHLWDARQDFGVVPNQIAGYLGPRGFFFVAAGALHIPAWIAERLWIAALMSVALWGMARLADAMEIGTPASRFVAAVAYAVSPLMMSRVGVISAFVDGMALEPLILLPLVRGSLGGSPRRAAALSGCAVLAVGAVNAIVPLASLVVPALWLLTRQRGPRRRALIGWWVVAVGCATLWWLIPLAFQARFFFDFVPFNEQAGNTTRFNSVFETLRGTGDWLGYLRTSTPWLEGAWTAATAAFAIVGGAGLVLLGLLGLSDRRLPHRFFLALSLLCGMAVIGGGYRLGVVDNPVAGWVVRALQGPLSTLRNTVKFQPLVTLPLTLGAAHVIGRLHPFARHRFAGQPFDDGRAPTTTRARRWESIGVVAMVMALLAGLALPALLGRLVHSTGFDAIPSYWRETAAYVDAHADGGRVLFVPGVPHLDLTWGRTFDEPFRSLSETPSATRSLIPLGSGGSIVVLDTVEKAIASGGDPAVGELLRRSGFTLVVARNDINWRNWNAPRPLQVHQALVASGLTLDKAIGPSVAPDASPEGVPDRFFTRGETDLHEAEVYRVPSATGLVESAPLDSAVALAGGPGALPGLTNAGLAQRPTVISSDVPPSLANEIPLVVTDSVRRSYVDYGLSRDNTSYILGPDERVGGRHPQTATFEPGVDIAASGQWQGVASVMASSYGSWLGQLPEMAPGQALDGDPSTAWVPSQSERTGSSAYAHQWWRVEFDEPVAVTDVNLQFLHDGPWRPMPTQLRVRTDSGTARVAVSPTGDTQHLAIDSTTPPTRFLEIGFDKVTGGLDRFAAPGLDEVTIPGVTARRVVHVVDQPPDAVGAALTQPASFTFQRATTTRSLLRRDEEPRLERSFTTPDTASYSTVVHGRPIGGPALFKLLDGDPLLTITASSTIGDDPGLRPSTLLDDNVDTAWIPRDGGALTIGLPGAPGRDTIGTEGAGAVTPPQTTDPTPTLNLAWPTARSVSELRIAAVPGFTRPASINISAADGTQRLLTSIPESGLVSFEPMTTDRLVVTFPTLVEQSAPNIFLPGSKIVQPLALSTLSFPALDDLAIPRRNTDRVTIGCASGPALDIDGTTVKFSADASTAQLLDRELLTLHPCTADASTAAIGRGDHRLSSLQGSALGIDRVALLLPAVSATATGSPTASRPVRLVSENAEARKIAIDAGAQSLVVLNENFNVGWRATLDGRPLTAIRVDGWRMGFVVPAGGAGLISVNFAHVGAFRLLLAVGAALIALLVGLAIVRTRQSPDESVHDASVPRWLCWAIVVFAAVWIGGVAGAASVVIVTVMLRRRERVFGFVIGGALVVATVLVVAGAPSYPNQHRGTFGWPAQILSVLAVVMAVGANLLRRDDAAPELS